jgi:hypothetical protein
MTHRQHAAGCAHAIIAPSVPHRPPIPDDERIAQ